MGGPLFPNVYVRILTKSEIFCKNQKCSLGPKTQNKPLNFFWDGGLPNRGGGGLTFGKNSQKIPYFFLTGSLRGNIIGNKATRKNSSFIPQQASGCFPLHSTCSQFGVTTIGLFPKYGIGYIQKTSTGYAQNTPKLWHCIYPSRVFL